MPEPLPTTTCARCRQPGGRIPVVDGPDTEALRGLDLLQVPARLELTSDPTVPVPHPLVLA